MTAQAARLPAEPLAAAAIALDAGTQQLTYAALGARVDTLAAWLAGCPGPVAVLSADPWWSIPALLAARQARVPYAPLDPAWPVARLRSVAERLQPGAVLAAPDTDAGVLAALGGDPVFLNEIDILPARPAVERPPGEPSTVFFTSGSTGQPKGILGRPGAVEAFIDWERDLLSAGPGLRVSALAPPTFDASLRDALLPLAVGGTVCIPPERAALAAGHRLAAWLAEARVEVVHTVPTVLRGLLAAPPVPLPHLRAVLVAGEVLRPADVARWLDRFGAEVALYNLYGPTETTMIKVWHRVTAADLAAPTIPLGRPLPGTEIRVVDSQGRPRPADRPGEIWLCTPACALGYLGDPEGTAARFLPGDGVPIYRTGDLGVLRADGVLEFRGRQDHQVKLRGVRVELEEVEAAVAAVPGVREAAAGLRDGPDGEPRLIAWVVADRPPAELTRAVTGHLLGVLPAALLPSRVVGMPALPRLLNGKVDRSALALPADALPGLPPEGPTETQIAAILLEILTTPVGATDDFFALGGDSLQALRAVWRLNEAFGIELPIDAVYQHRTVRALAPIVDAARPPAPSSAPGEPRTRSHSWPEPPDPPSSEAAGSTGSGPSMPPAVSGPSSVASTFDPFAVRILRRGAPAVAWLPPSYGLTFPYRPLVDRLGRPAIGLDLTLAAPCPIEVLGRAAAAHLAPLGPPWTLVGWSFGGVLAFEAARQLDPTGTRTTLVLLDSAAPTEPFDFGAGDPELAALAAQRLGRMLGRPLRLDPEVLRPLTPDQMLAKVLDLAQENGVPITAGIRTEAAALMATRSATMAAWRTYDPAPWPGGALVVRSADAGHDWTQRWARYLQGPIRTAKVPGDHQGMLEGAGTAALAHLLGGLFEGQPLDLI